MPNLDIETFDRILSNIDKDGTKEYFVVMNPFVWNGYWNLKYKLPKYLQYFIKYVGKIFHNRHIYWLGFPIYWVKGLRDVIVEELICVKKLERN